MQFSPISARLARISNSELPSGSTAPAAAQTAAPSDDFVKAPAAPNAAKVKNFKNKPWTKLTGSIMVRERRMGIGGEAPPGGPFLVLDKPIFVNGRKVTEVRVNAEDLKSGAKVTLNGRLNERKWGGVETKGGKYVELSGVTNLTKGEPTYDGKTFKDKSGNALDVLTYSKPQMWDGPAELFILDRAAGKAWLGFSGGMLPPQVNPFHGINGAKKIKSATAKDQAEVLWTNGKPVDAKSGKALELIGEQVPPAGTADMFSTGWYLNEDTKKIYAFVSGGFAGFVNRMSEVIK
jgi:hypothetical protein